MNYKPLAIAFIFISIVGCSSSTEVLGTSDTSRNTTTSTQFESTGTSVSEGTSDEFQQDEDFSNPPTLPSADLGETNNSGQALTPTTLSDAESNPVIVPKPDADVAQLCASLGVTSSETIESPDLTEISGAAWTSDGVWVHNDAGNPAELHLIASPNSENSGELLRTINLEGQTDSPILDAEDITVIDGDLLLADTGNNVADGGRDFVQLIRVNTTTEQVVGTFRYQFPNGSGDVEAIIYDPVDSIVYLIQKARTGGITSSITGPATIYSARLTSTEEPTELNTVGQVDLGPETLQSEAEIHPNREGQLLGIITAADISSDGSTIAIRTYDSAWIYQRQSGHSVVQALQTVPCEAPTNPEPQGEAIAFNETSNQLELATISESSNQPINVIAQ